MRRVVITGMGAVTPIGNNVAEFKEAMFAGKNGIDTITKFDVSDSKWTLAGEVKNFDAAAMFGKPAVKNTDMFTLYAMAAADEAMEQSGIQGKIESDRIGVCFGSGIGGMDTLCTEHQNLLEKGARKVSPRFVPKMIYNIAAGNLAIRYNANGPCTAVSTACATGATAIGEAYRTILHGYADAMICGGSEAAINPLTVAGFGNCQALSTASDKDNACMPFDKRRNGFIMAEGAGVMVLEDYDHAVARGANIIAEVCGYGSTCDAHHVTAPDPEAKYTAKAFLDAYDNCGVPAEKIYVNAHGTSTPLNDATETNALKRAFGEDAKKLHISSTKSMTGHMLGATGTVEAIAAVLALTEGLVPPTINYKEADPELDLDYTPNTAVKADLELAMSSNLGFGGHNAVVAFKKV
ncbi:MAG: beta-ketoacyl-ACP synthase II [Oscillospiraceae bacterium]|nr:beta-ketoacyl-ACP synthase II [Oscillospiraceae bacterium]MBQ8012629.1 beta-ketoacyl-ACP synthase II [Oscillospiraceae bacterium]MBQ9111779.1 beta-ketoacyl-ACP synthase II [Oscillospiraceae bacterium]